MAGAPSNHNMNPGNALPQRHIEYEHRMGSAGTRIPAYPPIWSQK